MTCLMNVCHPIPFFKRQNIPVYFYFSVFRTQPVYHTVESNSCSCQSIDTIIAIHGNNHIPRDYPEHLYSWFIVQTNVDIRFLITSECMKNIFLHPPSRRSLHMNINVSSTGHYFSKLHNLIKKILFKIRRCIQKQQALHLKTQGEHTSKFNLRQSFSCIDRFHVIYNIMPFDLPAKIRNVIYIQGTRCWIDLPNNICLHW